MKLRYAPRAKADIAEIHAYIADRNAKAATAVVRRLKYWLNSPASGAPPILMACVCYRPHRSLI